jgi:hypothetical protein
MIRPPPPPPPDDDDSKLGEWLDAWEKTVTQVVQGYGLTLDDWLNDMDVRQAIEESLPVAPLAVRTAVRERLGPLDETFIHATEPNKKCVWGTRNARLERWNAKRHWWYFRRPLRASPELLAEIAAIR